MRQILSKFYRYCNFIISYIKTYFTTVFVLLVIFAVLCTHTSESNKNVLKKWVLNSLNRKALIS